MLCSLLYRTIYSVLSYSAEMNVYLIAIQPNLKWVALHYKAFDHSAEQRTRTSSGIKEAAAISN